MIVHLNSLTVTAEDRSIPEQVQNAGPQLRLLMMFQISDRAVCVGRA
jgi:hypothetical protein